MQTYSMIVGDPNPWGGTLLLFLGVAMNERKYPLGRLRDVGLLTVDGERRIVLFTRNGGPKREDFEGHFRAMRTHPEYVRDYDHSEGDSYCTVEFKVPKMWTAAVDAIVHSGGAWIEHPWDKMGRIIQAMTDDPNSPEVLASIERGRETIESLHAKFKAGARVVSALDDDFDMTVKRENDNEVGA